MSRQSRHQPRNSLEKIDEIIKSIRPGTQLRGINHEYDNSNEEQSKSDYEYAKRIQEKEYEVDDYYGYDGYDDYEEYNSNSKFINEKYFQDEGNKDGFFNTSVVYSKQPSIPVIKNINDVSSAIVQWFYKEDKNIWRYLRKYLTNKDKDDLKRATVKNHFIGICGRVLLNCPPLFQELLKKYKQKIPSLKSKRVQFYVNNVVYQIDENGNTKSMMKLNNQESENSEQQGGGGNGRGGRGQRRGGSGRGSRGQRRGGSGRGNRGQRRGGSGRGNRGQRRGGSGRGQRHGGGSQSSFGSDTNIFYSSTNTNDRSFIF